MSKKKTSRKSKSPTTVVKAPEVKTDLRREQPVRRMRLVLANTFESMESHITKLTGWAETNPAAEKSLILLTNILGLAAEFGDEMVKFEETGWSPARKSFSAKTDEGDRVAILDDMRTTYADLMNVSLMSDLLVIKKHAGNRGGGLIVEAAGGERMKVAISHVVKLSSAAT
jgi:hypothetical protein